MSEEVKLSKKEQYAANKKDKAAEIKEKRRELASKMSGGAEPTTNPLDYKLSLLIAMNWYNINADYKKYREWLNDYLISTNRKKIITLLNKVSDYEIKSVGTICRLKSRDQFLEDNELNFIETKISELLDYLSNITEPVVVIPDVLPYILLVFESSPAGINHLLIKK